MVCSPKDSPLPFPRADYVVCNGMYRRRLSHSQLFIPSPALKTLVMRPLMGNFILLSSGFFHLLLSCIMTSRLFHSCAPYALQGTTPFSILLHSPVDGFISVSSHRLPNGPSQPLTKEILQRAKAKVSNQHLPQNLGCIVSIKIKTGNITH